MGFGGGENFFWNVELESKFPARSRGLTLNVIVHLALDFPY